MINTLSYSTLFQTELDKKMEHIMLTSWMDRNAGQVIYNGGKEVKIPKMSLVGLGNYDRDTGYKQGAVTLEYETRTMTQDRGRKFRLDAMDVNETNFVASAGAVMGEFQRTQVAPEVDAYRLSKVLTDIKTKATSNIDTTVLEATNILAKLEEMADKIRDAGYQGEIICHITYDTLRLLKLALADKNMTTSKLELGNVSLDVYKLDEITFIPTPKNRMVSVIELKDGSDKDQGGFIKGSLAKQINFLMAPITGVIAVTKQDKVKIVDPDTNQDADAWDLNYRRYHDVWVKDNVYPLIVANTEA
ncbi:hypothetical protein B7939_01210 [Eggerthia catenaformis]|nr:hypothetical protein B7939_01210 [Eggerthia catenaformis]